ncbi:hypothetical protein EP331_03590 [bacterium]|nr:MAG: hypothetical protein EP331_03590 [bacterium]
MKIWSFILTVSLTLFAALTFFLSVSIIFDWNGLREAQGNFVWAIIWLNLICSIIYFGSAFFIAKNNPLSVNLLRISLYMIASGSVYLSIHILNGGLYESKTIGALVFRFLVSLIFFLLVKRFFRRKEAV